MIDEICGVVLFVSCCVAAMFPEETIRALWALYAWL